MITTKEAQIARKTLVDVATPDETMGVIAFLSRRDGVSGAMVDATGYADAWYPLTALDLYGSSRVVVNRYLNF